MVWRNGAGDVVSCEKEAFGLKSPFEFIQTGWCLLMMLEVINHRQMMVPLLAELICVPEMVDLKNMLLQKKPTAQYWASQKWMVSLSCVWLFMHKSGTRVWSFCGLDWEWRSQNIGKGKDCLRVLRASLMASMYLVFVVVLIMGALLVSCWSICSKQLATQAFSLCDYWPEPFLTAQWSWELFWPWFSQLYQ